MLEHVKTSIQRAELVLIGIGEEFDIRNRLKEDDKYQALLDRTKQEWLQPFLEKVFLEKYESSYLAAYQQFASCLKNKNYFVVSLCQDGLIRRAGLYIDRIVEPCGTYEMFQCSEGCTRELYPVSRELIQQVRAYCNGEISGDCIVQPVCPVCGQPLVLNRVEAEHYVEEGYLSQWQTYRLWLQGTLNKKLCILELGVGMKYPTVVRWPFEKVAFFNQKAELFRVHSKLYQMTEEMKERGYGICRSPIEFVKELSNMF